MKTSVSLYEFRDAFMRLRPANFSYSGLDVLFEYLEQLENDTGDEIELDVIAFCCEYAEDDYETIKDEYAIPLDFDPEDYPDEDDYKEALKDCVIEYLENEGVFIGDIDGDSCVYHVF